jgi:hypothetical protein
MVVMVPDAPISVFLRNDSATPADGPLPRFNHDPATKTFQPSVTGTACGYACPTAMSAKDYIFTEHLARNADNILSPGAHASGRNPIIRSNRS